MDVTIERFFVWLHHPLLTSLAEVVTTLGSELVLGSAVVVLLGVLLVRGRRRDALMVAAAMAGAAALTIGLKHLVQRPRPGAQFRAPGEPADGSWSFPSGHTLHATVFVVLLLALVWPLLRTVTGRRVAVAAAVGVAVAVGISRVYLGYHWPSDVLGGWALGAVWSMLVIGWFRASGNGAPAVGGTVTDGVSGGRQVGTRESGA